MLKLKIEQKVKEKERRNRKSIIRRPTYVKEREKDFMERKNKYKERG